MSKKLISTADLTDPLSTFGLGTIACLDAESAFYLTVGDSDRIQKNIKGIRLQVEKKDTMQRLVVKFDKGDGRGRKPLTPNQVFPEK